MREKYIRSLIRLVEESDIESLEVSSWGRKIRIIQSARFHPQRAQRRRRSDFVSLRRRSVASAPAAAPIREVAVEPSQPVADNTSNLVEIKSPMVGTFYRAPSPDSPPVRLAERADHRWSGGLHCRSNEADERDRIRSQRSGDQSPGRKRQAGRIRTGAVPDRSQRANPVSGKGSS